VLMCPNRRIVFEMPWWSSCLLNHAKPKRGFSWMTILPWDCSVL
jgi:hypothetical protein